MRGENYNETRTGGAKVVWRLYESPSGIQIVRTVTYNRNNMEYKEYIVSDGCLVLYYDRFEV